MVNNIDIIGAACFNKDYQWYALPGPMSLISLEVLQYLKDEWSLKLFEEYEIGISY